MIGFTIEAEGLREMRREVHRVGTALDAAVERAVRTTSREVAREARRSHGYQDRTGRLTRSIVAYEPTGKFSDDTLEGMVGATMPYASFVEDGTRRARAFKYLGTAWFLRRDETEGRMQSALDDAVARGSR